MGEQYNARPPHVAEAEVEGDEKDRPSSIWEALKGSFTHWLKNRK